MAISAKDVMNLRKKTGAGMMDCKKALSETDGDMQAAIDYLREKGISKAAKKAGRIASEGLVFAAVSADEKIGAMVEFNSETDFVAKNDDFVAFGKDLTKLVIDNNISTVEELKALSFGTTNVEETLTSLIATIGENMNIRRFSRVVSNSFVTSYLHMGGKIGVLLHLEGDVTEENKAKAKDIAMHIAAMAPEYHKASDVPAEILEHEKHIIKAQLLEEGKPEKIIERIMIGKVKKYYEENCLENQKFVKDDKLTVSQYAGDLKIAGYVRYKLGEGLEKKNEDFAAEVAAQIKQ
ncbi:MAG: elongation factor Ts [Candidatus Cloacimonetes bacterium]|nr:elongation factor Ts [Candidatus Cloacimonadota bacterium]